MLTYIGTAVMARPDLREVVRGTLVPQLVFDREFLTFIVAVIGSTLSAYLVTWQSNAEVEEKVEAGRANLDERKGATNDELARSRRDILTGMVFANVILYFVMLVTSSSAKATGIRDIENAAQAAAALEPVAWEAASALFAIGVLGVGFLAVPIMTTGVAYDSCQALGWNGLNLKTRQAKAFYACIVVITLVATGMNTIGINAMRALVWAGVVQGFSTPPLMLLVLLLTASRKVMGDKANVTALNVAGALTVLIIFGASVALIVTWFI